MPVNIYRTNDPTEQLAVLAENDWNLASQTEVLAAWLELAIHRVEPGD